MTITLTPQKRSAYGNSYLPHFNRWIEKVEREYGNATWDDYVADVTGAEELRILQMRSPYELAWIEASPLTRCDPTLNFFSRMVYETDFDLNAPKLRKRFKDLLTHLHPDINSLWESFEDKSAILHGCPCRDLETFWISTDDLDFLMPILVKDFCDHALLWSYINGISLQHPDDERYD